MKSIKLIFFLLFIIILNSCKGKNETNSENFSINIELKNKLETILLKDQGIREIVNGNLSDERKTELLTKLNLKETDIKGNKKFLLMNRIDSLNLLEVENIIKNYFLTSDFPAVLLLNAFLLRLGVPAGMIREYQSHSEIATTLYKCYKYCY